MTKNNTNKRERYFNFGETLFWIITSIIFFFFLISKTYEIVEGEKIMNPVKNASNIYGVILTVLILFPIIFKLTFRKLPFESLRNLIKNGNTQDLKQDNNQLSEQYENIGSYTKYLIQKSEKLSEKIFDRAGVYLLVGIMIALVGIIFFSLQVVDRKQEIQTIYNYIIAIVPNVGLLFFIELIAFFFFKQYRITMDEFRYYEAIKRQRETNLLIILLSENKNFDKISDKITISNNLEKLKENESNELIEMRKLSNNEIGLFDKLIDKIPNIK